MDTKVNQAENQQAKSSDDPEILAFNNVIFNNKSCQGEEFYHKIAVAVQSFLSPKGIQVLYQSDNKQDQPCKKHKKIRRKSL